MRLEETMPALALVPSEIIKKWQEIVDLLAEIMHVPSAVVTRVEPSNSEVFVASDCKPSEAGSRYCETVMKTGRPLLVPDARRDERWKSSPDIKRGMVSYLGVPISWPNGETFGTICVYDNKSNEYSQLYLRQLLLCRDVLQNDLRTLATLHSQLEQHEAKIRRLVDANIIGIIIWDLEGHILEANDAFLRMGGYDREDLISGRLNRTDLTPPEWRERDARTDAELKMIGAVQPFEKEYFRKDGGRVPVLIGLAAFSEERDQGVAFVLDLTERKRAEDALREREAQLAAARRELRQMIDTIPIPVASYSADARRDFVNAAWKQYTGLSDEAAFGTEWAVVAHPDHIETGEKMWHPAFATGEPWHTEERVRRADGQYRWFAIDRVAARDENGRIIKWYGTAYDIEDRKRAEDALRESERSARSALDGIAGLVAIMTPNGEVETVNRQCVEYFGRPVEEQKDWVTTDMVHPEDLPDMLEKFKRAIASEIPYHFEQRLRRSDGEYRWFETRGGAVRDDTGRVVRWYVLLTDIEDRKRAEQALRERE